MSEPPAANKVVRTWETEMTARTGTYDRAKSVYTGLPMPISKRYCVYGSHACPWATRVNMILAMLGLREHIDYVFADPVFGTIGTTDTGERLTGWVFSARFPDTVNCKQSLREVGRALACNPS